MRSEVAGARRARLQRASEASQLRISADGLGRAVWGPFNSVRKVVSIHNRVTDSRVKRGTRYKHR